MEAKAHGRRSIFASLASMYRKWSNRESGEHEAWGASESKQIARQRREAGRIVIVRVKRHGMESPEAEDIKRERPVYESRGLT